MKIFKKIIKFLIIIPNIPFIVFSIIYLVIKTIKETGITELSMTTKEDWDSNVELNNYIDNLYHSFLFHARVTAILFYGCIIANIYLNN